MDEVKRAQDQIHQSEEEKREVEEELGSAKKSYAKELENIQKERESLHQEVIRLKEQLKSAKDEGSFSKNIHYEEEIRALRKENDNLHHAHQERIKEWEEVKKQDHNHLQQLDAERQRLVERLADSVSQLQRQSDYIKELRDEISQYKQKVHQYQSELAIRDKEFEELRHRLEKSEKEEDRKEIDNLNEVINNFRQQYQAREAELRQAQQHLAKKIKETTLLRDLVERQKIQLSELQNSLNQHRGELTRIQSQLGLQRQHEEKLHLLAKERAVNAEEQSKTWQQKFMELQALHLSLKIEHNELSKIKKSHDLLLHALNNIKISIESLTVHPIKPCEDGSSFSVQTDE